MRTFALAAGVTLALLCTACSDAPAQARSS
jgi:hypothetical protein